MKKYIFISIFIFLAHCALYGQDFYPIQVKPNNSSEGIKLGIRSNELNDCDDCGTLTFLTYIPNLKFESGTNKIANQTRNVQIVDGKEKSTYIVTIQASNKLQQIKITGPYIIEYPLTIDPIKAGARRDFIIEYAEESNTSENPGSYFINSIPENAKITIKGEPDFFNYTPYTIRDHAAGKYYLTLEKAGFKTMDFAINIEKGIHYDTTFILKEDFNARGNLGSFYINTVPEGARISIKGEPGFTGQTPYTFKDRVPGKYYIKLEKSNYNPVDLDIDIEKGKQSDLTVKLIPEKEINMVKNAPSFKDNALYKVHRNKQIIWFSASVISAGGAGYFKYIADKKYDQYLESTDINELESIKSHVKLYDKITYGLVGLTAFCLVEYTIHTVKKGKIMKQYSFNISGDGVHLSYNF